MNGVMQKMIYSYEGEMNNAILNSILYAMEHKMVELGEKPPFIKKLNSVMIECCQNLIHHSDQPYESSYSHYPSVTVYHTDEGYLIHTRNLVQNQKVEKLKHYIDKINNMSKNELKEYFQTVLTNGQISAHGGGGLGLLNIIRKSKELHLDYEFEPANDDEMFFYLSFTV